MTFLLCQFTSLILDFFQYNAKIKISLKPSQHDSTLKYVSVLHEYGCRSVFARFYLNYMLRENREIFKDSIFEEFMEVFEKDGNLFNNDKFLRASIQFNFTDQFYNQTTFYYDHYGKY